MHSVSIIDGSVLLYEIYYSNLVRTIERQSVKLYLNFSLPFGDIVGDLFIVMWGHFVQPVRTVIQLVLVNVLKMPTWIHSTTLVFLVWVVASALLFCTGCGRSCFLISVWRVVWGFREGSVGGGRLVTASILFLLGLFLGPSFITTLTKFTLR